MSLFRKSVTEVLKKFTSVVEELDIIIRLSADDINDAEIRIKEANDEKEAAKKEMARANSVKIKLQELLS